MRKSQPFVLLLIILLLISCQQEEYEVFTEQDQNSISVNTETFDLVVRAAMYDGSVDDAIDSSPCFSLEFPYTVIFQGMETEITSESSLRIFLNELPANAANNVVPVFPLRVKNAGHQSVTVRNRQQFAGLQQACRNRPSENNSPIRCVQFLFPLQVTSYDPELQQTDSAILNSQEQLYTYLNYLASGSVISFQYPFQVTFNNRSLVVNNRSSFISLLDRCKE